MSRLDGITLEELHEIREQTEGGRPRERVLAAIGRKQGDHLDTLAERHGVVEKTIRNWLDRFAEEPIEQAPYDGPRPGGPSKLESDEREQLFEQLQEPPTELGYDHQAWSPKLLLHYVEAEYGVESKATRTRCCTRPGCPGGQHGLVQQRVRVAFAVFDAVFCFDVVEQKFWRPCLVVVAEFGRRLLELFEQLLTFIGLEL